MFTEKKEKLANEPGTGQNRINEGTTLKGDIESSGFFRIDGHVEGTIKTPSKVVLGKSGVINGTLTCENADIEGSFTGNLDVSGTLTLRATAHIEGEVIVGKLAVEPGATFDASCTMHGSSKNNSNGGSQKAIEKEPSKGGHPFDRQQRAKKEPEPLK
jgi:cytoskeletal protein CcmA (bactofilin family)